MMGMGMPMGMDADDDGPMMGMGMMPMMCKMSCEMTKDGMIMQDDADGPGSDGHDEGAACE